MKRQNEYEKNFLFNVCQLLFLSFFEEAFKSLLVQGRHAMQKF